MTESHKSHGSFFGRQWGKGAVTQWRTRVGLELSWTILKKSTRPSVRLQITSACCRRSLSESGNSLMGKRRLLYDGVRVFLVKRGQNPPSMAAAGVGGARSLPWLLRAGHSGLELVGARAAKTSRGASNTRWAKRRRHAAATLPQQEKCVCAGGDQWPWWRRS